MSVTSVSSGFPCKPPQSQMSTAGGSKPDLAEVPAKDEEATLKVSDRSACTLNS